MISPSRLISSIKMDLGLIGIRMPFDNIDELIMEIIKIKTLPVFNELYPYKVPIVVDIRDLKVVEHKVESTVYVLPDIFGDKQIMMINKVESEEDAVNNRAFYDSGMYLYSMSTCFCGYEDLMLAQAQSNLIGSAIKGITFKFIPPNQIEIFSEYGIGTKFRIEVCLEHSENLTTLPATTYTSFLKLATLDVKKYMYDNLKHYDNLSTSYGQIAMRIDDWSGADDQRQQLIEKWEQTYHLDLNQYIQV